MKGRAIVRKYKISTPFRRMVKSTRYRKPQYTARTLLKAPVLRDATVREVTNVVKRECEALCRKKMLPSYLYTAPVQSLKEFDWGKLMHELHEKAPVLTSVLENAAKSSEMDSTRVTMVGMAAAILLKARSKRMCKVQTLVASLLYAGHAAKAVSENYMCICVHVNILYIFMGF